MIVLDLSNEEILSYIKKGYLPVHQKALVKDITFKIPVVIFTPTKPHNKKYSEGHFQNLLQLPVDIIYWEFLHIDDNSVHIKEFIFNVNVSFQVTNILTLSWLEYYALLESKHRKNLHIACFVPMYLNQYISLLRIHSFQFLDHQSCPTHRALEPIKRICMIFDPLLEHAYEEIMEIQSRILKIFPLSIDIHSLPMEESLMQNIFYKYDLIHFSGHINKQGIQIHKSNYFMPKINPEHPPSFLFLNGCQCPIEYLGYLSSYHIPTVFSLHDQVDKYIPIQKIAQFYLGLFSGYKIQDIINFQDLRFLGSPNFSLRTELW